MQTEIQTFVGKWLDLPPPSVCKMGDSPASGSLGVTSHGLRHQYLHAVYKRLTGCDAPIKGATTIDVETHRAALKTLIEHAGHSDVRKATAYLGSPTLIRKLDRLKTAIRVSEPTMTEAPPPLSTPSDSQARAQA